MRKTFKKMLKPISRSRKRTPMQSVAAEEAKTVKRSPELTDAEIERRMDRIDEDFRHAFSIMRKHPDTVSFFGSSSAVIKPGTKYYEKARLLASKIVEELGLSIVSGGGPGIMEAANRGAREAHGDSVGMAIELPHEQVTNKYATHAQDFYYFFSRKVALTFTARAYIFFPGGYGTLDELFEILTLKENEKIAPLPVILVGKDYWQPLIDFIENTLFGKVHVIEKQHTTLYTLEDDFDAIIKIIREDNPKAGLD